MNNQTTALAKSEPKFIEYTPFGAADKIKLSVEIVKRFVCIPTKSGKTCDDAQATKFMMLCQTQRLNPFAGDCFLAGYDGKNGAVFSMITAHVAFIKRAESSADYEGMESGIILVDTEGKVTEREGDFHLHDESCVGGWARVFRKGRKPTCRRLSIAAMIPAYETPFWSDAKKAGQIVKCAEADALRATFPTLLGGLYTPGESSAGAIEVSSSVSPETSSSRLVTSSAEPSQPGRVIDAAPPNDELAEVVTSAGFDFNTFQKWGVESGNIQEAMSLSGFEDIKADVAKRILRAKAAMLTQLENIKAGGDK